MSNELRKRRLRLKLTIGQMAEKTGLDKGLLSRLENRRVKNPWPATVRRAADGYGMTLEEVQDHLFGDEGPT